MLPVSLDCPIFILLSLRYSLTFLYSNRMGKKHCRNNSKSNGKIVERGTIDNP